MSMFSPASGYIPPPKTPQAPPPPVFANAPQGQKPGRKSAQPSFLGTGTAPAQQQNSFGGKTLLGSG